MTALLDEAVAYEWLSAAYGEAAVIGAAGLPAEVRNSVYWDVFTYGPAFREVQAFFDAAEVYEDPQKLQAALLAVWDVDRVRPSDEKMKAHGEIEATLRLWSVYGPESVSEFHYLVHSLDVQTWRVCNATSGQVNSWHLLMVALVLSAKYFPETMLHYLTFACDVNPALQLLGLPVMGEGC